MFLCFSRSHFVILTLQTHPAGLVRQPHSGIPGVSLFLLILPGFQGPQGSSPPPWWGSTAWAHTCALGALCPHSWPLWGSKPQPPLSWSVAPGLGARLLVAQGSQTPSDHPLPSWTCNSPLSWVGTPARSAFSLRPGAEGGDLFLVSRNLCLLKSLSSENKRAFGNKSREAPQRQRSWNGEDIQIGISGKKTKNKKHNTVLHAL